MRRVSQNINRGYFPFLLYPLVPRHPSTVPLPPLFYLLSPLSFSLSSLSLSSSLILPCSSLFSNPLTRDIVRRSVNSGDRRMEDDDSRAWRFHKEFFLFSFFFFSFLFPLFSPRMLANFTWLYEPDDDDHDYDDDDDDDVAWSRSRKIEEGGWKRSPLVSGARSLFIKRTQEESRID